MSNVDPFTGQSASLVNPNSIEAIEVVTGGASVSFGRAQGGFANIVQKQGTNEYEGVFDFFFRSSVLDGNGANDQSNLPDPEFDSIQPIDQLLGSDHPGQGVVPIEPRLHRHRGSAGHRVRD